MSVAIPGRMYKHYKIGTVYEVVCIAIWETTGEEVVIYREVHGFEKNYCRLRSIFEDKIIFTSKDNEQKTKEFDRFKLID